MKTTQAYNGPDGEETYYGRQNGAESVKDSTVVMGIRWGIPGSMIGWIWLI